MRATPVINGMKCCGSCNDNKSLLEYSYRKDRKCFSNSCKKCVAAKATLWRQNNKEQRNATALIYRVNNPEKCSKWNRDARARISTRANILFHSAKLRAEKKSLGFNITKEYIFLILTIGYCQKTGFRFQFGKNETSLRHPFAPSIDRQNNSLGYTFDNIQIVCNMYNTGKGEANEIDFLAMCLAVVERNSTDLVINRLKELRDARL
jgi:hypothetical protein